ncbi:MAG: hypothetical protein Edafosvirus24_12, partial [Edafosvirus sp.]
LFSVNFERSVRYNMKDFLKLINYTKCVIFQTKDEKYISMTFHKIIPKKSTYKETIFWMNKLNEISIPYIGECLFITDLKLLDMNKYKIPKKSGIKYYINVTGTR